MQSLPQTLAPAQRPLKAAAEKCAHCGITLTRPGTDLPFIGVLGPECVKKYGSLVAALEQVDGLEAHEHDEGSMRLAHRVILDLRRAGVVVRVVDVRPGTKAVKIGGLSRKADATLKSWQQVRAEFEQRLKLAAAEREAQGWVAA